MKIVVAIEGMDGSGKTSLARFAQRLCQQYGQRCSLIGRRTGHVSPVVVKLTQVLGEEVRNLTPQADVFLRIARDYQRAHLAASAPPGLVLLDRFILTLLSLARVHGHDIELLSPILREIIARADLHATIFIKCPFEVAWMRVEERHQKSARRIRSEKLLRRAAEFMEEDFYRGIYTGQQWLVENSKSLADTEEQLASYLLPYLEID